jgi:hypothetical protein
MEPIKINELCLKSSNFQVVLGQLALLGQSHRPGGCRFYLWLKTNKYPSGYQVLCMNCQFVKKAASEGW